MILFKKILEIISISIKNSLIYIADTWSSIAVSIIEVIVFYFVWMAVYGYNSTLHGIDKAQIITYIILSRIIYMQIGWGLNLWVSNLIQTGQISIELLKPLDFQSYTFFIRIGEFLSSFSRQSIPALIASSLLLGILPPYSVASGILFIISLLMAVMIASLIEFGVGLIAFYTASGWGLQITKYAVIAFFSGALVPISFFPQWLNTIVNYLPFKDMLYTPISIYLGLAGDNLIKTLLVQLLWIVILFLLTRFFFYIAIRKVTVQGG